MSVDLPIEYSDSPPPWLGQWPSDGAIRKIFPRGIREYCYRLLGRERQRRLSWSEDRLTLVLGAHEAKWQIIQGEWRRECTCGYRNDRCVHLYAACCLLREILKHESWEVDATSVAPKADAPGGKVQSVRSARLDTADRSSPPAADNSPMTEVHSALPRLEVEVDFHYPAADIGIRFYRNENERRSLLRLQQVYNMGSGISRRAESPAGSGTESDDSFLRWLTPRLRQSAALRRNLKVLPLSEKRFLQWMDRWSVAPRRFIERETQRFLNPEGTSAARLLMELEDKGEWVQINAIVATPMGQRYHYHEILRMLSEGKAGVVSGQSLTDFKMPLDTDLLKEFFSRKSPRMRREHVCRHLPHLLEGHLELVTGKMVRHVRTAEGKTDIEASCDKADILLYATVEGVPIFPDGGAMGNMTEENGNFVITVYETPSVQGIRSLFARLDLTQAKGGKMRLAGEPRQLDRLLKAWDGLPAGIRKHIDQELMPLFDKSSSPVPEVILVERKNFVDIHAVWKAGDCRFTESEIETALREGRRALRTRDGSWLRIDPDRIKALRKSLADLGLRTGDSSRFFRPLAGKALSGLLQDDDIQLVPDCRSLAERVMRTPAREDLTLPDALHEILRPYQKKGFEFLSDRFSHRIGAILADDMGLGKTLQVLSLLLARQQSESVPERTSGSNGFLVVCPASVTSVWMEHCSEYCPSMKCALYSGPKEKRRPMLDDPRWDMLVVNYALLRMDSEIFAESEFHAVVLDEAQYIKNPDAQVTASVKKLRTEHTLALTGTPLENRLLDLWSIVDFLNPGFLGNRQTFVERYEHPQRREDLVERIKPVILRRRKESVAAELPPKTEETLRVELTEEQRRLYDSELLNARKTLKEKGPVELLAALTRLRQICCHPGLLIKGSSAAGSAKLQALLELIEEVTDEGHSALVFSQFTSMLELIESALGEIPFRKITGSTPTARRGRLVKAFNEIPDSEVFLLSLKAAGIGLTLTKADYVFIFDPWWNPATERQAIDRTHRIGQDKPVFAYRLVAVDTVEEKVLALQQEKARLFDDVIEGKDAAVQRKLTAEDIERLLA